MFIYSWLHLAGFKVSSQDVADFRKLHSITPGHPEFDETEGVEATTGPLGQGVGNAVGYALSGKRAAARYNTADHTIFDHHVVALAGDGCLQEGVAQEAIAFAGHNQLDNLILIYDSNDVTLDAMADKTQGWDSEAYFKSLNWDAVTVDGHDMDAFLSAFTAAKAGSGKPTVIIAKTEIGRGIPQVAGTASAHGEGGANFSEEARKGLGLPEQTFFVSDETKAYFAAQTETKIDAFNEWQATYDSWAVAHPELSSELEDSVAKVVPTDLSDQIPAFGDDYADATRGSGGVVINAVAKAMPSVITGSADLFGSTKNYLKEEGDFTARNPTGRNIWFGIREHGMGAICNGVAYDGLFRISGATFCVFADYLRPSIRIAGLAKLPVTYILTHDSVGVGEDGPTHQPIEQLNMLRLIPNSYVFRPCDMMETIACWKEALKISNAPSFICLSRQNLPQLSNKKINLTNFKGAYVIYQTAKNNDISIIATGSEVSLAIETADLLQKESISVKVISMPSSSLFDQQSASFRKKLFQSKLDEVFVIEAGSTMYWNKFTSTENIFGIDDFGASAPAKDVYNKFGLTPKKILSTIRKRIK